MLSILLLSPLARSGLLLVLREKPDSKSWLYTCIALRTLRQYCEIGCSWFGKTHFFETPLPEYVSEWTEGPDAGHEVHSFLKVYLQTTSSHTFSFTYSLSTQVPSHVTCQNCLYDIYDYRLKFLYIIQWKKRAVKYYQEKLHSTYDSKFSLVSINVWL